ncbi:MAG: alpha/beta hydrolase [Clostridia bacterium]|nr:alpha/beta hydrolase [Clostridia bacterium]
MIEKKEFRVLSSDGIHTLSGFVYLPDTEIKGFFQVVHGMTDHIARYDKILTDMAGDGWISFGYDHLGHGKTAKDDSELGFIAKEKGWDILAKDVKEYSDAVRKQFGTENLPFCLMGHSMGSFVVRLAVEKYVKPDCLIVMGTAGSNPAAGMGLALISVLKLFKGERHISPLIDNIAFGSYNKRFGGGTNEDPSPWLTNDETVRKAYYNDKYCTFKFTLSAMGDLIKLIKYTNRASWYHNIPPSIPILLLSGEDDPVGNYGKGVKEVETKLKKRGIKVCCKLYKNARHEILNDFTYEAVRNDIFDFCNKCN